MAVLARAEVTLSSITDVAAAYRYYLLQSATLAKPAKPTTWPPGGSWDDTEPGYTNGSTNSLYFVDCTVFSDHSYAYSEVSLSSSYEAAKEAYNKANNTQIALDGLTLIDGGQIKIDGSKIYVDAAFVNRLFAQDITATGKITGVTLEGAKGHIGGWNIEPLALSAESDYGSVILYPLVSREVVNIPMHGSVTPYPYVIQIKGYPGINAPDSEQHNFFAVGQDGIVEAHLLSTASHVWVGDELSVAGNANLSKNLYLTGNIYPNAPYTTEALISPYWKDGSRHSMLGRAADGLTCNVGWNGSADYATVLNLRGRTVRVMNSSGTSTLSDERMKKDWRDLDSYNAFFDALHPQAFRYLDGSSGRYHLGFGAQSVEQALSDSGLDNGDFGGLIKYAVPLESEDWRGYDEEYGLIYSEFVALAVDQIQRLKARVQELERQRDAQARRMDELEKRLAALEGGN